MANAALPHSIFRHGFMCLATAGLLLGCVEGGNSSSATGSQTIASPASRGGSAREVEAPEVFQVTDSALWDGRPSLGGIWVASPNVTEPERVVILNPATGKSVNGALFRRERDNPGPPLQVSSDAAEALGMLAGQPTSIRVTALRKPAEAKQPAESTAVAAAAPAEAATEAAAGDPAAAETAALATAALAATGTAAEAAPEAAAVATAAADGAVEAVAAEPPKPKTWKERRAEAKARREAEKAAKAAAATAAAGAEAGTEGAAAGESPPTADSVAVAAVETAPLDARAPEVAATPELAAAPEPAPKKTRRQIREEQEAAKAAAAAATAAAEATAPAAPSASAGRTIQIASFSKEENANRAIEALAKVNVTAQARKSEQGGNAVWGVVATGDNALLASIKKAGFADAFFLN